MATKNGPLFMGASGRGPSRKGSVRFWWKGRRGKRSAWARQERIEWQSRQEGLSVRASWDKATLGMAEGDTALLCAAQGNNVEGARLLLERGAMVDEENESGATAAAMAVLGGSEELLAVLLEFGADVKKAERFVGKGFRSKEQSKCVSMLEREGALREKAALERSARKLSRNAESKSRRM